MTQPAGLDADAQATLHLVVGPSGAGKDTLIDAARSARPDIAYPTRIITRRGGAGGEAHEAVDWARFEAMEAAGAFFLSWRAHDLAYGVPIDILDTLGAGDHVLVNVSRRVLDTARARWAPLRVISIVAPIDVLAARLAARGRETPEDVAARLARAEDARPEGADVIEIDNSGSVAAGVAAFLAALAPPRAT